MPTTITGGSVVTTTVSSTTLSGSTVALTGGITMPAASTAVIRAWANVYNSATATCSFVGFNISSITLVSTGLWDITFANPGYADVNSVASIVTNADTNYNIMFSYDKTNSTTSKIRIKCYTNANALYTSSAYNIAVMW